MQKANPAGGLRTRPDNKEPPRLAIRTRLLLPGFLAAKCAALLARIGVGEGGRRGGAIGGDEARELLDRGARDPAQHRFVDCGPFPRRSAAACRFCPGQAEGVALTRSEERRVGKEGGSRGAPGQSARAYS